jgi:hypothetical protein
MARRPLLGENEEYLMYVDGCSAETLAQAASLVMRCDAFPRSVSIGEFGSGYFFFER